MFSHWRTVWLCATTWVFSLVTCLVSQIILPCCWFVLWIQTLFGGDQLANCRPFRAIVEAPFYAYDYHVNDSGGFNSAELFIEMPYDVAANVVCGFCYGE